MCDSPHEIAPNQSLGQWTIELVELDAGGYDEWGEYFGHGDPLFVYDGELSGWGTDYRGAPVVRVVHDVVRAGSRAEAIVKVLARYPMADFGGAATPGRPT